MANRWLFVMVARCLQQLRLVKRPPPSKTLDIFGDNLASVSCMVDSCMEWPALDRILHLRHPTQGDQKNVYVFELSIFVCDVCNNQEGRQFD